MTTDSPCERVDLDDNDRPASKPEVTLKFRSSDLFLAADMQLKAKAEGAESKFEEDTGPLSLTNAGERFVASPRSARSQFSRSTSQTVKQSDLPQTLEDIDKLYPTFSEDLQLVADEIDLQAALESGPEYRELVYRSSKLDLTNDTKAKFALTIWYEGGEIRAGRRLRRSRSPTTPTIAWCRQRLRNRPASCFL